MTRLDAFVAILDILKELSQDDCRKLIGLLFTMDGANLRFLLKGDPGPPNEEADRG